MSDEVARAKRIIDITMKHSMGERIGAKDALTDEELEESLKNLFAELAPGHCLTNFKIEGDKATFDIEKKA